MMNIVKVEADEVSEELPCFHSLTWERVKMKRHLTLWMWEGCCCNQKCNVEGERLLTAVSADCDSDANEQDQSHNSGPAVEHRQGFRTRPEI